MFHASCFMEIIGNQKVINLLEKSIKKGSIAQAYLFSGPESVGKFTVAKLFAQCLIKGSSRVSIYPHMTMDKSRKSPEDGRESEAALGLDLIIIEPEKEEKRGIIKEKEIKIERIRDVQKELALFPYQGKYKVLIINNAHRMTEEAQNALLKILEEPNPTSIIILVTHEEDKMLSTIQSRCQKIRFNLVSPEEMRKNLKDSGEEIISLSLGRPGIAFKMAEDKEEFKFRSGAAGELKSIAQAGINERLKIAEELSRNVPQAIKKLELWVGILHGRAIEEANTASAPKIFGNIEKIEKSLWEIKNTNASSRLALENLLLSF